MHWFALVDVLIVSPTTLLKLGEVLVNTREFEEQRFSDTLLPEIEFIADRIVFVVGAFVRLSSP
jgi:hypothetical protein